MVLDTTIVIETTTANANDTIIVTAVCNAGNSNIILKIAVIQVMIWIITDDISNFDINDTFNYDERNQNNESLDNEEKDYKDKFRL